MTRIVSLALAVSLFASAPALAAKEAPEIGPLPDAEYIADINAKWRGVGVGYDNGLWGQNFGQGVKLDLPFGPKIGQFVGLRLRGLMIHEETPNAFTPVMGGGAELFGRGPVLMGIVRVYGGGGVYYGEALNLDSAEPRLTAGGHYGVEVLVSERNSFTFEVGGQGPMHPDGRDAGASVMAGTTFYFGDLGKK